MNKKESQIKKAFEFAQESYAEVGVNINKAIDILSKIKVSMHCWQGDDVGGFENPDSGLDGGIQVTGNYPGKARTIDELKADLEKAYSFIPGKHKLNLHAFYADTKGRKIERNEIYPENFSTWVDWAKENGIGLDFNPTFFSHTKASDGFTLSHIDKGIRNYWIEHGIACRKIAEFMGKETGQTCITNFWIPDGYKDVPADRLSPRLRLKDSLDKIFKTDIENRYSKDAVESKLFGIGCESYTVGSNEFYLGYAVKKNKLLCLDAGHFHPTETISDKISSSLIYINEILLHVSRGVRWDSDHVVTLTDDLKAIAEEIVRGDFLERVYIGLDFFDATINRIAAWVIGTRSMLKALLMALLEPRKLLCSLENKGDFTSRLALFETIKTKPFGSVWDYYCLKSNVPLENEWIKEIKIYEDNILSKRK